MKYESEVRRVCGEDWQSLAQEIDGGYGVAIIKAYIHGVKPNILDMAKHLYVPPEEISRAFTRLVKNGVIGKGEKWRVRSDSRLLVQEDEGESARMWAFVAAIASGFAGVPN